MIVSHRDYPNPHSVISTVQKRDLLSIKILKNIQNKNNIKDNDFLIIRNNLICINFKNKNLLGFVESFDENTNKIRMYDSRYPKRLENQPERFKVASGKGRKYWSCSQRDKF